MLTALLDGRALPAGELAYASGVTPQTASSHLSKLLAGGLLALEAEGGHRYYRLAVSRSRTRSSSPRSDRPDRSGARL
jgi:DNA-binding transcriptional ArsR family regulator